MSAILLCLGNLAAAALAAAAGHEATVKVQVLDSLGTPMPGAVVFVSDPVESSPQHEVFVIDQVKAEFVPRVLVVPVGSSVRFPNKDKIQHHVYSFSRAKQFDLELYSGEPPSPIRFDKPGLVKLGCNIHDWMEGYILVTPTAVYTITDAQGRGELRIPRHKVQLAVFHERARATIAQTQRSVPLLGDVVWRLPTREFRPPVKSGGY